MKKPKYSILIPTYNKAEYLQYSIKSVLNSDYQDFELIVSNDFSDDNTEHVLSEIKDRRFKKINPPIKLSQAKNYEFLLSHASGEWITILGDDDGILPLFFETLDKYTNKFQQVELIHTKPSMYYWENVEDLYGQRVCHYENFYEKAKIRNSKLSLLLALSGLANRTELPMIYTSGVVKMDLIKKIKSKSSNLFFHSIIPDYYSMVCLMYETDKYLKINEPLFWVGTSRKSTGRGTKIYENDPTTLEKYDFINNNLELSSNISSKLHMIGLSSIYFFECILKHPYISQFWKNNLIKYLVFASSKIQFYTKLEKYNYRIKIDISKENFEIEHDQQLKNDNLNKFLFYLTKNFLLLCYLVKNIIKNFIKVKKFVLKKFFKKHIILVSKNREKFKNFIECNNFLEDKLKKN